MDVTSMDSVHRHWRAPPARSRLAWLCVGYAATMVYSSTVIGPAGFHFVPLNPTDALRRFLSMRFEAHGSDQRADWMGNVLMLIPFGCLATATLWPRRRALRLPAMAAAMLICAALILAVKYLQLFFPPRTVNLNYVAAQSLGAIAGCTGFAILAPMAGLARSRRDPAALLVLALWLYCAALLVFLLMPLDFALNRADLLDQWDRLPVALLALPGAGRPWPIRVTLIAASTAAFMPAGILLTFVRNGRVQVRRGLVAVALLGLPLNAAIFAMTALVMGAAPSMVAIVYRTAGMVLGAAGIRWLVRQDPIRLRARMRRAVPWLAIPYLIVLIAVNRLWSVHWRTPEAAIADSYRLGLLPLFDYYIVTKAEAAKNIAGHVAMYLPVGVALWFRDPGPRTAARAFCLAAVVSFAVEAARYLRPGLEGDINAVMLAGLAAMLGVWLMPAVWPLLATLSRQSAPVPVRTWDKRDAAPDGDGSGHPPGEIEHF